MAQPDWKTSPGPIVHPEVASKANSLIQMSPPYSLHLLQGHSLSKLLPLRPMRTLVHDFGTSISLLTSALARSLSAPLIASLPNLARVALQLLDAHTSEQASKSRGHPDSS